MPHFHLYPNEPPTFVSVNPTVDIPDSTHPTCQPAPTLQYNSFENCTRSNYSYAPLLFVPLQLNL
jgi:hypothetical protein